jgi:hypothetical protein
LTSAASSGEHTTPVKASDLGVNALLRDGPAIESVDQQLT